MKASTLSALSTLFAGLTLAHPVDLTKRSSHFSEVDITILQFALTVSRLLGPDVISEPPFCANASWSA
jgi:hypothetical protein